MRQMLYGIALSCACATTCAADWQYTKWGMSIDQVVKASKGKATPYKSRYSNEKYQVELAAPYQSGPFAFEAHFEFQGANGLAIVSMHPVDRSECPAIERAMSAKYGPSDPEPRRFGAYKWDDRRSNNEVRFVPTDGDCVLMYRELTPRGAGRGL